jgi:2-phosphoglycerate kinase
MVLCLHDEALHRARLEHRLSKEPGRDGARHLRHLDAIRSIQTELRRLARERGVEEHDVSHPEDLTQHIVDFAVAALDGGEVGRA